MSSKPGTVTVHVTLVGADGTTYQGNAELAPTTSRRGGRARSGDQTHALAPEVKPSLPPTEPNLVQIIGATKQCDEAERIETQVLDRSSQVNRTLLPLYVVHEHFGNAFGLTSGDISKITSDLGVPISRPNVSTTLSGAASRYVVGDKVKRKGQAVAYKLSRRGLLYMKELLSGKSNG